MVEVDPNELLAAEEKNGSITRIVEAFEEQLRNVEVTVERPLNIFHSNIVVQVLPIHP